MQPITNTAHVTQRALPVILGVEVRGWLVIVCGVFGGIVEALFQGRSQQYHLLTA
jgi:hypothetical protein